MKKSITILLFLILIFLIPSFCSAYSIYNYDDLDDLNYISIANFVEKYNINNTTILRRLFSTDFTYCFVYRDFNDVPYIIVINDSDTNGLNICDSSYFRTNYNASYARSTGTCYVYNLNTQAPVSCTNSSNSVILGNGFDFVFYNVFSNTLLDIEDNTVGIDTNTFKYYYNNEILNIDISSFAPEEPEEPEEPSGEIIDYSSKFDYIINILYLNVFLQFLLVIYYVIRSTFRYD